MGDRVRRTWRDIWAGITSVADEQPWVFVVLLLVLVVIW